jgi:hypothetical protein
MFGLSLMFPAVARFLGGATVKAALGWALPLAALLAGAAAGGWGAWHLGRAPLRAEAADLRADLATLRTQHAEEARLAAGAGAKRLQEAQDRSEALATDLLQTLADQHQQTEETTHALQTATTGRACLSDRAVRLLQRAPGITLAGADGLPPPRAGTAAAGAAAAASAGAPGAADPAAVPAAAGVGTTGQPATQDHLEATDTAVAVWVATAGGLYQACAERLGALIAWHRQTPPTPEPLRGPAP